MRKVLVSCCLLGGIVLAGCGSASKPDQKAPAAPAAQVSQPPPVEAPSKADKKPC